LTTSSKLWLGFGLPTGLLFLSVLLILLRVSAISVDIGGEANKAEQRSATARILEVGVGEYALLVHRYLRLPGPEARQAIAAQIAEVEREAAAYERLVETERQQRMAEQLRTDWQTLKAAGDALTSAEEPVDLDRLGAFSRLREGLNSHLNGQIQPEAVTALGDSRQAALMDATRLENLALFLLVAGTALAVTSSALIGRAVLNTERSAAEQSERMRTTLASIGDAVITTDLRGRVDGMNAVAEALTGWSLNEAKGRPLERVFNIVHEQTREPAANPAARALREGAIVGLANHTVLIAKDGSERPIDDSAAPIRSDSGGIVGCVLVFRDVAERQRAEREVRASADFTLRLLDSLFAFVGVLTPDGTLTQVNKAPLEAAGIEAADVVGKKFWDAYWWANSPENQAQLQKAIERALDGELVRYDVQVRMAGGRLMWIDFQLAALRDDDGRVTHLIPSGFDISGRKEAEEAIRTNERRQRLAIEAGGIGYWDWDLENQRVIWGPGARALYGRDVPGGPEMHEDAIEPILAKDREATLEKAAEAIAAGKPFEAEFRVVWPDDSIHWLYARGEVSEWAPDGTPTHMVGINIDITVRKAVSHHGRHRPGHAVGHQRGSPMHVPQRGMVPLHRPNRSRRPGDGVAGRGAPR
jgi:PAS domain S-box-containing protein